MARARPPGILGCPGAFPRLRVIRASPFGISSVAGAPPLVRGFCTGGPACRAESECRPCHRPILVPLPRGWFPLVPRSPAGSGSEARFLGMGWAGRLGGSGGAHQVAQGPDDLGLLFLGERAREPAEPFVAS